MKVTNFQISNNITNHPDFQEEAHRAHQHPYGALL